MRLIIALLFSVSSIAHAENLDSISSDKFINNYIEAIIKAKSTNELLPFYSKKFIKNYGGGDVSQLKLSPEKIALMQKYALNTAKDMATYMPKNRSIVCKEEQCIVTAKIDNPKVSNNWTQTFILIKENNKILINDATSYFSEK
jgi:hypothetical protein